MKGKIFIIDDEEDICELLSSLLSSCGHDCYTSFKSEDAFELISKEKPDLILCDLIMPKLSGVNLIKQVKSSGINCKIIGITATDNETTIKSALIAGASEVIEKPFDFQKIATQTSFWLNQIKS